MEAIREDHVYFTILKKSARGHLDTIIFGVEKEIAQAYYSNGKKPVEIFFDERGFDYTYDRETNILTWKYPFIKKGYEKYMNTPIVEEIIYQGLCHLDKLHVSEYSVKQNKQII